MSYTQRGSLVDMADPELARSAVREMADVGGDWLFERAVENTPVSYHGLALQFGGFAPTREPGTLKRAWRRLEAEPAMNLTDGGWRVVVRNDDPIAQYVEWDTQPHIITPKLPGGVLVWRSWPTGEIVRAKLVHHPGTTGQHMMGFAAHAATLGYEQIVDRPLREWAERSDAKALA